MSEENKTDYQLFDSHCHFDLVMQTLNESPEQLLKKTRAGNLGYIIIPGLDPEQWQQIQQLSEQHDELYFAAGLHPWWIEKQNKSTLQQLPGLLAEQLEHPRCIAVGECGLDSMISTDLALQESILKIHLKTAQQYKKPVILHSRKTDHHLLRLLKEHPLKAQGVLHAFTGHPDIAKAFIKNGLFLGIGGTITYPRARKTIQSCEQTDLKHLLLETDAPDMPLQGFQGQTNRPEQVKSVAKALAEIKQIPVHEIIRQTTQNALCLFNLKN